MQEPQLQEFDSAIFNSDLEYSEYDKTTTRGLETSALWTVDDRVYKNPALRFSTNRQSFTEMIYECGGTAVMEGARLPKGLVDFLNTRFLPPLNVSCSRFISLDEITDRIFHFMDWQEPYFFLVKMPISLIDGDFKSTFKHKKTGSVLDPQKIEIFKVNTGWKFPDYVNVNQIVTDPRTAEICSDKLLYGKNGNPLSKHSIFSAISSIVYAPYANLEYCVSEWVENHYDEIIYDTRVQNATELDEVRSAKENDFMYWVAVTLGVMTWFKSPHGLKFLMSVHPIYDNMLTWDHEKNHPVISEGTGGWAVVDGWSIYTARDIDVVKSEPPGTCCVSKQTLHCTKLVNAKAIMNPCYCGKGRRNIFLEDPYENDHRGSECRRWDSDNPAQMVFISYAALDNILEKREPRASCQRSICPMTSCSYHIGAWARIRDLTNQRTKMLTASVRH